MSDTLEELAAYMDTTLSLATRGTDLFAGRLPPDTPDLATAIELSPVSRKPEKTMGPTVVAEYPRIQVKCRGSINDMKSARDRAMAAYRALIAVGSVTISGTRWMFIEAIDSPGSLGQDENGRFIYVFNLEATKEVSAA